MRKARIPTDSKNTNPKELQRNENKIIRKDWLPSIDPILNITKQSLCVERRSVKDELLPDVDYCIIHDELNEHLQSLYKVYSSFQFPHLPKIGVINSNGHLTYERELPSYQVKLKGLNSNCHTNEIVVKLSPYTKVSEFINFILYKNHIQGQYKSIELFENTNSSPLNPNQTISSSKTNSFILFFSLASTRRRRTVELDSISVSSNTNRRKSLGRILSPHMKELWSCIEVDSV